MINLPPAFIQVGQEFPKALAYLLVPAKLLYFAIYFKIRGNLRLFELLTFLCVIALWLAPIVTPLSCGLFESLQKFTGITLTYPSCNVILTLTAVAIGTMKSLDIWARRHCSPEYSAGRKPADWLLPIIMITELRYESFTPNHIRVPKQKENFSEPIQLGIHLLLFLVLQAIPQAFSTVLAIEVLLAIYIIWTSIQLILRYKTSPALFGPLYLADSLTGFWCVFRRE
jgi:hypothetical protein